MEVIEEIRETLNKEPEQRFWHKRLKTTGYLLCGKGPFPPRSSEEQAEARKRPKCEECHFKSESGKRK